MNAPDPTLEQRVITLEQLITISRQLNSMLEMRLLLPRIVESARDLTDADDASILLVEGRGEKLRFAAATSGSNISALESVEVPIDRSLAGWVVRNQQTAIVEDAQSDPRMYTIDGAGPTLSIVAAPMIFGDKVIGVLESLTQRDRRSFTAQDVETLETLASIAAVAVQNARLFQQSDWVAEVVHEIRTPLTAIISYADLLQRDGIGESMREQFAAIIQHEGERVNTLVTQFLDLARLESGRVSLARDRLHIPTLISLAVNVMKPLAEKQNTELRVQLAEGLPPILGDSQRIHQVLLNLISNAVKYSGSNATVTIKGWYACPDVVIAVTDSGPGIPPELQSRLFQKFARLPGSEQRVGTGLGLLITRQIIEAHGGRIWVESEVGKGSTFAFSLPAAASSPS